MTAPRVEVDLGKIRHNARCLVERLKSRGISVTAVTKAVCGHPQIAQAMLDGGAAGLGEARMSNVKRLRKAGIKCPITLIRTPMLSQVDQVTRYCDASYNTEMDVIARLAEVSRQTRTVHDVLLMVEMGDMREGIMPERLEAIARQVMGMPGVVLKGIGANFACLGGATPDAAKMATLSTFASEIEAACRPCMETISGGNSANLPWAVGPSSKGRISNLRLGEAILLGVEPVSGDRIDGLFTDAFSLIGEVIETRADPVPTLVTFTDPALAALRLVPDNIRSVRSIIALGNQDTDTKGLALPTGVTCLGASSDHMVVQTIRSHPRVGNEIRMHMNYNSLMRAMNAPDITTVILPETPPWNTDSASRGVITHPPCAAL